MIVLDHYKRMAAYNAWMNGKVYAAAAGLPKEELVVDKGAFFGSILGTLNHLAVTDIIWLTRFAVHPAFAASLAGLAGLPRPVKLDEILIAELGELQILRRRLDTILTGLVGAIDPAFDFDAPLSYRRANGEPMEKPLGLLFSHLFNHQTHHRGQVTTLLSQAGVDVGVTDLQAMP
jgi:uncharacterized damage-inducible protein DinB